VCSMHGIRYLPVSVCVVCSYIFFGNPLNVRSDIGTKIACIRN